MGATPRCGQVDREILVTLLDFGSSSFDTTSWNTRLDVVLDQWAHTDTKSWCRYATVQTVLHPFWFLPTAEDCVAGSELILNGMWPKYMEILDIFHQWRIFLDSQALYGLLIQYRSISQACRATPATIQIIADPANTSGGKNSTIASKNAQELHICRSPNMILWSSFSTAIDINKHIYLYYIYTCFHRHIVIISWQWSIWALKMPGKLLSTRTV